MPQVLDRCVKEMEAKGYKSHTAYAICVTSTKYQRKKGGGWVKREGSKEGKE